MNRTDFRAVYCRVIRVFSNNSKIQFVIVVPIIVQYGQLRALNKTKNESAKCEFDGIMGSATINICSMSNRGANFARIFSNFISPNIVLEI